MYVPISVPARCKVWVCGRSLAGVAGSIPSGSMDMSLKSCVLSGGGLCDGLLIIRQEGFYRVWCVLSVIVKPPY